MKDRHTYPNLNLTSEELATLDLEERDLRCLECGVKEVASWADQGPVAPAVSSALLTRVKRRQQQEWMGYAYKIAAGFVVLILFFQIGKNQGIVTSDNPREATHFAVDSALNDTAFLLKEDPSTDTVKAVSFIKENQEMDEEAPEHDLTGFAAPVVATAQTTLRVRERESGLLPETEASGSTTSRASPTTNIELYPNSGYDQGIIA